MKKRISKYNVLTDTVWLKGTPEKLIEQLKFDSDGVDTYVEDFLLTYRTFVATSREITSRLLAWCDDYSLRDKVFSCFYFLIVFIHAHPLHPA